MAITHMMVAHTDATWKRFERHAIGFGIAADKLHQELTALSQAPSANQSVAGGYAMSVPVLRGLATECALKALAQRSKGKHEHEHDLVKLYHDLPTGVQRMLETSAHDDGKLPPFTILERHQNDFVDWRYPKNEPVISNLVDLPSVLDLMIKTLNHSDFIALCRETLNPDND